MEYWETCVCLFRPLRSASHPPSVFPRVFGAACRRPQHYVSPFVLGIQCVVHQRVIQAAQGNKPRIETRPQWTLRRHLVRVVPNTACVQIDWLEGWGPFVLIAMFGMRIRHTFHIEFALMYMKSLPLSNATWCPDVDKLLALCQDHLEAVRVSHPPRWASLCFMQSKAVHTSDRPLCTSAASSSGAMKKVAETTVTHLKRWHLPRSTPHTNDNKTHQKKKLGT